MADLLEKAVESALAEENLISDKAGWEFVDGLRHVAKQLGELTASEPERAARGRGL